jgi:hypothetical protein
MTAFPANMNGEQTIILFIRVAHRCRELPLSPQFEFAKPYTFRFVHVQ